MAKKKLTTEQIISKYKKKRRMKIGVTIAVIAVVIALLIPVSYYGYYYMMFTVFPQGSENPDKVIGVGYCKPLHAIPEDNTTSKYVLAYYYDDCWHVIDDGQKLRECRDKFVIYKEDNDWHEGTHLQLMLIKNTFMYDNYPLSPKMLIDDRCFKDCTKLMTMEEFEKYVADHGFTSVLIK